MKAKGDTDEVVKLHTSIYKWQADMIEAYRIEQDLMSTSGALRYILSTFAREHGRQPKAEAQNG